MISHTAGPRSPKYIIRVLSFFIFILCFLSVGFMLRLILLPHVTAQMATSCSKLLAPSQLIISSMVT